MPASRLVRLKGSGEEGGAAGNAPAAFSEIWGSAGMGKIGRSYPRFDETLVDDGGGEPSVTALEVIVGLLAVFLAVRGVSIDAGSDQQQPAPRSEESRPVDPRGGGGA